MEAKPQALQRGRLIIHEENAFRLASPAGRPGMGKRALNICAPTLSGFIEFGCFIFAAAYSRLARPRTQRSSSSRLIGLQNR